LDNKTIPQTYNFYKKHKLKMFISVKNKLIEYEPKPPKSAKVLDITSKTFAKKHTTYEKNMANINSFFSFAKYFLLVLKL
jgi:hypothetical protein